MDLPNSAFWLVQLEARQFRKWEAACLSRTDVMPPKVWQKFSELKTYGQVAVLPNNKPLYSPEIQRFIVKSTPTLKRAVTLHFRRDAVGDVVSYFGTCSRSTPAFHCLPLQPPQDRRHCFEPGR